MPTSNSLSCTNCRQRKIECDRKDLCMQCEKAGLHCVFPTRQQRVSMKRKCEPLSDSAERACIKGNFAGTYGCEEEPLANPQSASQIGHYAFAPTIENELADQELLRARPRPRKLTRHQDADTSSAKDDNLDSKYASFVKEQDRTHYVNNAFWNQLDEGTTISNHSSSDLGTASVDSSSIHENTEPKTSCLFVFGGTQHSRKAAREADLSDEQQSILFRVFFANVHPICRILHRPTALTFMRRAKELMDAQTLDMITTDMWDDKVSGGNWNEFVVDVASSGLRAGVSMTAAWFM